MLTQSVTAAGVLTLRTTPPPISLVMQFAAFDLVSDLQETLLAPEWTGSVGPQEVSFKINTRRRDFTVSSLITRHVKHANMNVKLQNIIIKVEKMRRPQQDKTT